MISRVQDSEESLALFQRSGVLASISVASLWREEEKCATSAPYIGRREGANAFPTESEPDVRRQNARHRVKTLARHLSSLARCALCWG